MKDVFQYDFFLDLILVIVSNQIEGKEKKEEQRIESVCFVVLLSEGFQKN